MQGCSAINIDEINNDINIWHAKNHYLMACEWQWAVYTASTVNATCTHPLESSFLTLSFSFAVNLQQISLLMLFIISLSLLLDLLPFLLIFRIVEIKSSLWPSTCPCYPLHVYNFSTIQNSIGCLALSILHSTPHSRSYTLCMCVCVWVDVFKVRLSAC